MTITSLRSFILFISLLKIDIKHFSVVTEVLYGKKKQKNNFNRQASDDKPSSLTPSFIICTFIYMPAFSLPLSPTHIPPPSLSCLDPSLFHVPGENGVRLPVYFFTMSEPQAAHATSTRPLMPPDQEQVVNIIPLEGFSNVGCTLCEEAQSGEK